MANLAPLVPGIDEQSAEPPVPSQQETTGLADQWRQWMASPQNRASLIQIGLAMSQPIAPGQNALGHIGQAVGQGGEAAQRVTDEDTKQRALSSKQDLQSAQAESAVARAGAAEARAGAAGTRSDAAAQRLQMMQENAGLRANVDLNRQYHTYVASVRKQNALGGDANGKQIPEPTFDEFLSQNPQLAARFGSGSGGAAPAPASGAAPTKVNSPAEAQALTPGTRYVTPDGKVYTR